jgi:hypothetical protein
MLAIGTPIFLLVPDSTKKRILHPGKVIETMEGVWIAQLDETLSLPVGTEVVAFHTVGTKFMQQVGIVVVQNEPGQQAQSPVEDLRVTFKLVGEAVSAEQRQLYRVSVALANIRARIGAELDCHIVDISPEGCGAITRQQYVVGSSVQIHFIYQAETVLAQARVQTVRPLGDGRYRYGFRIGDKISPARRALTAISMAVQRQQLRRMSGAAA